MQKRVALNQDRVVQAAIDYVSEFGMESLTIRVLGERLGTHHTAIYRHFESKEELTLAMFDFVMGEVVKEIGTPATEPADRIRQLAFCSRRVFLRFPAMITPMMSSAGTEVSFALLRAVVADLRTLGVSEAQVAKTYRILESYVFGATMFDLTGAPNHLAQRKERYERVGDKGLKSVAKSIGTIERHNEDAFEHGFDVLLTGLLNEQA
jgi:AcrR family transcriptional regulator